MTSGPGSLAPSSSLPGPARVWADAGRLRGCEAERPSRRPVKPGRWRSRRRRAAGPGGSTDPAPRPRSAGAPRSEPERSPRPWRRKRGRARCCGAPHRPRSGGPLSPEPQPGGLNVTGLRGPTPLPPGARTSSRRRHTRPLAPGPWRSPTPRRGPPAARRRSPAAARRDRRDRPLCPRCQRPEESEGARRAPRDRGGLCRAGGHRNGSGEALERRKRPGRAALRRRRETALRRRPARSASCG